MRALFLSDFFLRFAGGFALGAVALAVAQPDMVVKNLTAIAAPVAARIA